MILNGFKLICCQCGSDNIVENIDKSRLFKLGKHIKYKVGIQRKCLDCDNESFVIHKTWLQEELKIR